MSDKSDLWAESVVEEEEFAKNIPTKGFIHEYMKFTKDHESPGSYHFWCAMILLSSAVQRRGWVNRGHYNLFPNLYIVLVGPTGRVRKTSAIGPMVRILRHMRINVTADMGSVEAMLEDLQVDSAIVGNCDGGVAVSRELSVMLNRETYSSRFVTILTDLYDCPDRFIHRTRSKDRPTITLTDVWFSLIGASTPEWLGTNLPDQAFEGGFMSRVLLIVKQERDRIVAWPPNPQPQIEKNFSDQLLDIRRTVIGEVIVTDEARKWFTNWYEQTSKLPITDGSLAGFAERKPDIMLKVALLLAASKHTNTVTIEDIKQAFELVTHTQERMWQGLLRVDQSRLGSLQTKILDIIRNNGGQVERRTVMRTIAHRLQNGVRDLSQVEQMMTEAGWIEVISEPNGRGQFKKIYKEVDARGKLS